MKMMKRITILALFVAGCGGDGAVGLEQWPAEFGDAYCRRAFECCTAPEIAAIGLSTEAMCRDDFANIWSFLVPFLQNSIAVGRMRYDGSAAAACLDEMARASCVEFWQGNPSPSCAEVFVPLVAEGGSCGTGYDCTTTYCASATQTCARLPGEGESCEYPCQLGLFCGPGRLCTLQKPDGEACTEAVECVSWICSNNMCGPPIECSGA